MTSSKVGVLVARTDAAFSLLVAILVAKGVISAGEMLSTLTDAASAAASCEGEGEAIASIFRSMASLIPNQASAFQ